ncbi:uncharacterized protein TRAVEDRAFT_46174 [Trametes versicolor FP-101664 SS1]|uniref:uncharacterized protein n=1 Tax=Trametes versicolor (strain FP-101664) TaxID=717944 RepID=UPI000462381F|nr:uncharacterized protein TRAVEDRAFT_46174 [Trametes versicolor FP-101664 SS1]EIW60937.1 hypothetical protein TRAVEDRAFT_46174 [Trametes versicolor FP-101664 SS1]
MRFFANTFPATALVAALALGVAAQTANEVVKSVGLITQTTNNYNTQFKRVSASNMGHESDSVPDGINALTDITTNQIIDVFLQDDTPTALNSRDAADVVYLYQESVKAAQDLVATLLEDHDLFAEYAVAGRVTQSVRAYRVATMQYMGAIKGVAESRSDDIIGAFDGLAESLEEFIQLYEQS